MEIMELIHSGYVFLWQFQLFLFSCLQSIFILVKVMCYSGITCYIKITTCKCRSIFIFICFCFVGVCNLYDSLGYNIVFI